MLPLVAVTANTGMIAKIITALLIRKHESLKNLGYAPEYEIYMNRKCRNLCLADHDILKHIYMRSGQVEKIAGYKYYIIPEQQELFIIKVRGEKRDGTSLTRRN